MQRSEIPIINSPILQSIDPLSHYDKDEWRCIEYIGEFNRDWSNTFKRIATTVISSIFDNPPKYRNKEEMIKNVKFNFKSIASESIFFDETNLFIDAVSMKFNDFDPRYHSHTLANIAKQLMKTSNLNLTEKFIVFIYIGLPFTIDILLSLCHHDIHLSDIPRALVANY